MQTNHIFYTVNGTEFDPTQTSDNCGIASVVNLYTVAFSLAGAQIPEGETSISWLITDNAGNNQTCTFVVTVNTFVGIEFASTKRDIHLPNPPTISYKLNLQKTIFRNWSSKTLKVAAYLKKRILTKTKP